MKKEKPIKIIPGKGKHATELRVFARNIHENYCVHPTCKYKGQHAVQGHCYGVTPELLQYDKLEAQEAQLEMDLKAARQKNKKDKDYITYLESYYVCAHLNWTSCLDEVVYLRRNNAALKHELKKRK